MLRHRQFLFTFRDGEDQPIWAFVLQVLIPLILWDTYKRYGTGPQKKCNIFITKGHDDFFLVEDQLIG